MQLYGFGESGNAYKVALALRMMGLEYTLRPVDFFGGETRTPEYRAVNPMGEVPVLIDGDTTLSQSAVILDYLSSKTGQLAGRSAAERREVLRWMFWDNHKFTGPIAQRRFLANFIPEPRRPAEVIAFFDGRIRSAAQVLEAHLQGRDWVASEVPTIADLSLCGYLFYPEAKGIERADRPAIDAWLARIEALPGWAPPYEVMPRAFPDA